MGKLQKQGNTGKKIMKKLRNGTWVAVAVMGLIAIPAGTVSAQETNGTDVSGEMTIQTDVELQWVANTVEQVQAEVAGQSADKDQSPLEQYDIIWGDTLSVIAQATDTTVDELVALNSIENPDLIYAGDVLLLANGTVAVVGNDQSSDQKVEQQEAPKQETGKQEEPKQEAPKQEVPQEADEVAVETPKLEDTVNPTPVTKGNDDKSVGTDSNESTPKEDVEKPKDTPDASKPSVPNDGVQTPGGVVAPPTNGGGNEDGGETAPDDGTDEDTDVEVPVEPNEPPVVDENPKEPETPGEGETPLPEDEEKDVDPEEPPVTEETPPVVVEPGTPGTEVPAEDSTEPVNPEENPVEEVTPPVVEVPGTPETPEEPATPEITTSNKTVSEQLGYNIIRRANPNLPVGQERVVQEGSYGNKDTVYKLTFEDGALVSEVVVSEGVTVQPVDTIIEYGTFVEKQPEITTSTRKVTEQIGFKEIRRANPELAVGEERVVQQGSFGSKETIYKLTFEDGVKVSEELVSEGVTLQPVNTIIEYGTKEAPEITTSIKTVEEQIGFKEIRRNNPDLPLGEERVVQEGSYGKKVFEYLMTYEDGNLRSEELVSETVTTEPVDRIIEVGTYVAPELNRVEKVLEATDEEAYNLANNMSFEDIEGYYNMTQDEMEQLAGAIDYGKLNAEFGALMNQYRLSIGVEELNHAGNLVSGTNNIAKSLADYGFIAPHGYEGHTLPNGQSTNTAFTEEELGLGRGENTAFNYNYNNPYQIVSEKYLAEMFFQQWMDSPGHKANMGGEYYTGFTLSVQPVVNGQTKVGYKDGNGKYVIEGNAGKYSGVGIVAVLSLGV